MARWDQAVPELPRTATAACLNSSGELLHFRRFVYSPMLNAVVSSIACALHCAATGAELSERTHLESPWLDARDWHHPILECSHHYPGKQCTATTWNTQLHDCLRLAPIALVHRYGRQQGKGPNGPK